MSILQMVDYQDFYKHVVLSLHLTIQNEYS